MCQKIGLSLFSVCLFFCSSKNFEKLGLPPEKKTGGKLWAGPPPFSMAMWIRRYGAKRIAQCDRSRATLDATGRRHWVSNHSVSPCRTSWSSISAYKIELWRCGNHFPKLAFKRHETDPLLSSLKQKSCAERSNATMKVEELSQLSSSQMLTTDKNCRSYQSPKKLVEKLAVMTANSC